MPFTTSLSYFDDGRPKTLSTANTGLTNFNASFSWDYLTNGWLNKQTAFKNNGASVLTTTYSLNQLAQRVDVTNVNANSVQLSRFTDIAYDAAGNHTSHTETLPFLSAFGGTQSYQYDSKDQLLFDQKTNSASDNYSAGFSFDSAGNLINGGSVGYNAANQLTSFGALYDLSGNQRSLPVSGTANRSADYETTIPPACRAASPRATIRTARGCGSSQAAAPRPTSSTRTAPFPPPSSTAAAISPL